MIDTDLRIGSGSPAPAVRGGGRSTRRARLLPGGLRWILPALVISVGLIYYSIVYSGYLSFFSWPGGRALMTPVGFGNYIAALQDPSVAHGIIQRPEWVQTPTAAQLAAPQVTEWPAEGEATLLCMIEADGRLSRCVIESISTRHRAAEPWALEAAQGFRHAARTADGRATAGLRVRLTLRWLGN